MKDWLQQANEENNKFNNSKYGKLSDGKLRQIEGTKNGGAISGQLNKGKYLKEWANENSEKVFKQNSRIGKKQGKINVITGHLKKVRLTGGKTSSEIQYQCEHCNKKVKGAIYHRWHGDNCSTLEKIKEQLKIIKKLNKKTFSSNDVITLCKKIEFNYRHIKYGILKNTNYISVVKVGTNQKNPSIFKLK